LDLRDIRHQVRAASGFYLSHHSLCKAKTLCTEAKNALGEAVYGPCIGGFRHSLYEYSDGKKGHGKNVEGGFHGEAIEIMNKFCNDESLAPPYRYDSKVVWNELPKNIQLAAKTLGYDASTWNADQTPQEALENRAWVDLTYKEKAAAKDFGYNKREWDGSRHYNKTKWDGTRP